MELARFGILDPAAGISGDMLLGALVAAGAPSDWLTGLPARLGIPTVKVEIDRVMRCGVACVQVQVRLADGSSERPSEILGAGDHHHHSGDRQEHDAHGHAHQGHPHSHAGHPHGNEGDHHRHVGDLVALVERAPLSPWVRGKAIEALKLLGEAEGRVHGMPWNEVHLHEVGAMDALVDIVGGIEGFERLGIRRVYSRPVALGNGWIRAAHGVMAVPAPATLNLLEGLVIGPDGPVVGEATTPTGAVLLRVLSAGAPPARWRAAANGWGAGGRDPHEYPNALRLVLAEGVHEAAEVMVLATDLDDLSPEYLEPLREALTAAGALDVQSWATQMKKGRVGFRVEVVVGAGEAAQVTDALFRHSSTAGVRRITAERVTLRRRELTVPGTDHASVRVKVLDGPGGPRIKPEYDDISAAARQSGRPALDIAREVTARAREALTGSADADPTTVNQEQ